MAAALGYHTGGSKARLCFHMQADSYDTDSLIGVLQRLAGFYRGQRWCCCGTGCRHTGAAACVPTWTPSSSGSSAAHPTSRVLAPARIAPRRPPAALDPGRGPRPEASQQPGGAGPP